MKRLSNKLVVFGSHDANTIAQATQVAERVEHMVLSADGHYGYHFPVGGVAALRGKVSLSGIGVDISCGVAALRTDVTLAQLGDRRALVALADEMARTLSFGLGRSSAADDAPVDHPLFESPAWNAIPDIPLVRGKRQITSVREDLRANARRQLGSLGGGNHFCDVFADENGYIWVMAHFGSRGLGHTVATNYMALGQGLPWGARPDEQADVLLDLNTPMGQDYWALMELCGEYAHAGREWVVRKVMSLFGGTEVEMVHQHHNSAWKETHDIGRGLEELIVVRKGATPAFPGQRGAVGGSMGDDSVILAGTEAPAGAMYDEETTLVEAQRASLYSTVHGAGRVMSRTAAAGKRNRKTGELKAPGLVSPDMMRDWLENKGVILRGGGLDESPHAYRRLSDVLASQGPTITVRHVLRPLIVAMAPDGVADPFKD